MEKNDLIISGAISFIDENYNTSVETFSKLISKFHSADGYLYRASALMMLGNYEEALKDLNEGEKMLKTSFEFTYKKGICLFYMERFSEAHDNFVRAALVANTLDQRSNLDKWMSKTKLEYPNLPKTNSQAQTTTLNSVVPSVSNTNTNSTIITTKAETTVDQNTLQSTSIQSGNSSTCNQNEYTHEWFQNPNYIFISINSKTILNKDVINVSIEKRVISIHKKENKSVLYELHLCNSIEPKLSNFEFKDRLISFNLKKEIEGFNWVTLEKEKVKELISDNKISAYPTSSKVKKNWEQIDKELDKEMKDNPESNEAMMNLFKQIYDRGDEKTKIAMKKSFQTSGGTVLSTNWDEVKEKDYEGKDRPEAPKGQEWVKY